MEEKKEKICSIESNEDLNYLDKIKRITLINRTDHQILIGKRKRTRTSAIYAQKCIRVENKYYKQGHQCFISTLNSMNFPTLIKLM